MTPPPPPPQPRPLLLLLPALLLALFAAPAASVALAPPGVAQSADWLVNYQANAKASAVETTIPAPGGATRPALRLSNGLLTRTFSLSPCFATVDLTLAPSRTQFVRALSPEATLSLNGTNVTVGGCVTDAHPEFFDPAANSLSPDPTSLTFTRWELLPVLAPFKYVPGERHSDSSVPWPPKGVHLVAHFNVTTLPDPNASTFVGPFSDTQLAERGPVPAGRARHGARLRQQLRPGPVLLPARAGRRALRRLGRVRGRAVQPGAQRLPGARRAHFHLGKPL